MKPTGEKGNKMWDLLIYCHEWGPTDTHTGKVWVGLVPEFAEKRGQPTMCVKHPGHSYAAPTVS